MHWRCFLRAILERHRLLPELRVLLLVKHDMEAVRVLRNMAEDFSALLDRKEALFCPMVEESQGNPEVVIK